MSGIAEAFQEIAALRKLNKELLATCEEAYIALAPVPVAMDALGQLSRDIFPGAERISDNAQAAMARIRDAKARGGS